MRKLCLAFLLLATFSLPMTYSAHAATPKKTTKKKVTKKRVAKKKAPAKKAPAKKQLKPGSTDTKGLTPTVYNCELKNKFTVYTKADDPSFIVMDWQKKKYHLHRVESATGADRYEGSTGLVWINIPAKSMLLNIKSGKQLANECKSPEQQDLNKKDKPLNIEKPKKKKFFF